MSEIDQQFVEYVIKSIVSNPDKVEIKRSVDERGVLLELSVDPEDLGRVIGKRGATAQSLRTLLRALGTKNEARYNLKIIDTGPPPVRRDDHASDDSQMADTSAPAPATSDDQTVQADQTDEPNEPDQVEAEPVQPAEQERVMAEAPAPEVEDDDQLDLASKTRRELAELDDLDV